MGILNEKSNKNGIVINAENYPETLKFEILEYFSKNISSFINENAYQEALSYVEENIGKKFEVPLRIDKTVSFNGRLNELIINEKAKFMNFFVHLKNELMTCKKFYFIVSFIKYSGIQLLISTLDELEALGIKGEIITSVYLNITDPKALSKLLSYKNIKVKIYNNSNESFHTKAYLFEKEKYHTCIIGSSNISQSALYSAEEWNVKLTDNDFFDIYNQSFNQFQKLWNSNEAIGLTEDFIGKYEEYKEKNRPQNTFDYRKIQTEKKKFIPNSMQTEILEKLKNTRKSGNNRGLVVAATGTGKTYLAAMDVKEFFKNRKNSSFLFIAHREELLDNAIRVFSDILHIEKENFGRIFSGNKEVGHNMIFASIQSLRNCYKDFISDKFNYIIVDEFHHASASSYEKIIHYFKPEFLLGLTATPERMDGKDILALCDYNLVGEMGMRKAMEKDLIVPFHYFGVNDITVDYEKIPYRNGKYDEEILLNDLSVSIRTDYIVEKMEKFGYDGKYMSGIAFCQNIKHALYMKNEFLRKGYKSELLTSKTNLTERSKILESFRNKEIEILCVVDILNEGIDIPDINLLLFLRPTLSSTVFIQQIGRGLRKAAGKDFVTIIDFIGNHKKDYLITKVFSDEIHNKSFLYEKKEKIIEQIKNQFSNIPGASYIELDRICQERIIDKIEKINFNSRNILKEMYNEFKNDIGKSPEEFLEISDFDSNIELFVELVTKVGSFYEAQVQFENDNFIKYYRMKNPKTDLLAYMEKKIRLCEPFTYLTVKFFLKSKYEGQNLRNKYINSEILLSEYKKYFSIKDEFKNFYLLERIFNELIEDEILEADLYGYKISKKYEAIFYEEDKNFEKRLSDLINLGLNEFRKNDIEEFNDNVLITHKEYKRIDLQILLDSKVPKGTWRAGYANTEKDICLFITNDKSHIMQENLKYDNSLHSDEIIQWISQPKTYHSSSVGQMFIKHREKNMKVHIFARKYAFMNGNKTNPFIYLGQADYYRSFGDKPMTILWKLRRKLPQELIQELYKL
jgi:type III restriction protein res subunit